MNIARIHSAGLVGLDSYVASIEVAVSPGYGFRIIGQPESSARESYHRIRSALGYMGKRIPGKKITVSLSPSHIKKTGTLFDVPIAIGLLLATGQIENRREEESVFLGELGLDGRIKPGRGAVATVLGALDFGFSQFVLPTLNASESSVVPGARLMAADHLWQVIDYLEGRRELKTCTKSALLSGRRPKKSPPDLKDIQGQAEAVRAAEVAAAGGHHILLLGAQGTGKSLIAERIPHLLPPLDKDEAIEVARIYSAAGYSLTREMLSSRPVRKPHHSIARAALLGGGSTPVPGEITLAHRGVLLMDELQLFRKDSLNLLRTPLDEGRISISRLKYSCQYPSDFQLVGTANMDHPGQRANGTLDSPVLDRIDMHVLMGPAVESKKSDTGIQEGSPEIRERVCEAREIQKLRFKEAGGIRTNSGVPFEQLDRYCTMGANERKFLDQAMSRLRMSLRGRDRIRRIARTLADLEGSPAIAEAHLAEALQYRSLDRE